MRRRWALLMCLAGFAGPNAWALAGGESAGAILKVGMGGRPAALGEAYSALGDDVFAAGYNPAALGRGSGIELGVQHAIWFEQSSVEVAGIAIPLEGRRQGLGLSALLFRSGELNRTLEDPAGGYDASRSVGTFITSTLVVAGGYAIERGSVRLGVGVKVLRDQVDADTVYSGTLEEGFVYPWPDGSKLLILTSLNSESTLPPNIYAIILK